MTIMKTQTVEKQSKFKSAPITIDTSEKLHDIHHWTGVQLYRIIQRAIEAEWNLLRAQHTQKASDVA